MAQNHRTVRASCLCGAAKHEITLPEAAFPIQAAFCHCTSCRRMSGSLCVTSIPLLSEDDYRPAKELLEKLTLFEFSKGQINHYFCPSCGTHMLAHVLPRERNKFVGRWFAMCGTLEDAGDVYWPRHEYIADTVDGGIADILHLMNGRQIERWARHPGEGEQLPLHWLSPDRWRTPTSPNNKLHAHCKCNGIKFWIARPADGSKYAAKVCACDSCRLGNGMEWFVSATAQIQASQISLDEDGLVPYQRYLDLGTLKTYRSSPTITKGFCATCGATVFLAREETNILRIAVGLLAAPEGSRAETWLNWSPKELQFVKDNASRAGSLKLALEACL